MNYQNEFLLPDKSLWQALNREEREALSSKYTILCPIILFTEFSRHGLSPCDPYLDLENIIVVHHWSERAKMDLLTNESDRPMSLGRATPIQSILESTEEELLAFIEVSGENIEMLQESEALYRKLDAIIDPLKEEWLNLVKNTDNRERKQILQASVDVVFDTYKADSLENAYQLAVRLFDHDPSDRGAAYEILQRLCGLLSPTQKEHTQIFNRFFNEDMPHISRFAPYALNAVIWNYTIQLLLRENPENVARKDDLRDAEYMFYTFSKNITFVSGDTSHRKFVNEVPLFEGIRENFVFVDTRTKEGLSKIL